MAKPRGPQGTVLGMPAGRVQELLAGAVAAARATQAAGPERGGDGLFARDDLRRHFRAEGLSDEQAEAMVHAFWRAVPPVPDGGYGRYRLPPHADAMVRHREWRLTSGRLALADVLRLRQLLGGEKGRGRALTPGLEAFRRRADKALRGLGLRIATTEPERRGGNNGA